MDIQILPGNIANMIAAGEVVQRPASVVKELMENAVDAGASQIGVVIRDAGRTLIQVTDNGCGMTPDEAVLCFERHATSKLKTAEDLNNILTYGFRGEALASIAAVAEVTLKTKKAEAQTACQVEFSASNHVSISETICPTGSNISVRNLFFNVPARRKFLKSDNVEFKHIVEEFTRVALTRPGISFTLNHNSKDIFVLRPAKSDKFRIHDILGTNAVDAVVDISVQTTAVGISGYVCRPDLAKKTTGNQFFFVNGRYFKSPYLHKAVMRAYEGLLAEGAVPSYFIFLTTDPHSIDVNIHPSKTEIKFEEDSVIFQTLYACIRESLGRNSFGSAIDFDVAGTPDIPVFGSSFDKFHPSVETPSEGVDPTYNPFEASNDMPLDFLSSLSPRAASGKPFKSYNSYVSDHEDYGRQFEDRIPSASLIVLDGRYIVTKARSGLLVINIVRARERIFYDRFLKAITANGHISQTSLFPVQIVVGVENRLIFEDHKQLLESMGFDISAFGNDTIVVNGFPEGFSCEPSKVEALMADVLLALGEDHSSLPDMMESAMATRFARMGAVSGGGVSSELEAQTLIDALFCCDNPEATASGNKIMNILPIGDIEKKF